MTNTHTDTQIHLYTYLHNDVLGATHVNIKKMLGSPIVYVVVFDTEVQPASGGQYSPLFFRSQSGPLWQEEECRG